MTDADLCRLLVVVADSLERDGLPNFAGAVRQGARRIAELPVEAIGPDRCPGCDAPILQPQTGRPRRWCGRGRCEARKTRENANVA